MSRRRVVQYASMTSLLDVLFIIVFATLVQASVADQPRPAAAAPVAAPPEPALPADAARLHRRALASLEAEISAREPVIARVGADRTLRAIESAGVEAVVGLPLLEPDEDPDVVVRYAGDRNPEFQLCALVARRLGLRDLAHALVVFAPDAPLADLGVAAVEGLRRDVANCRDLNGLAVIVEPVVEPDDEPNGGGSP